VGEEDGMGDAFSELDSGEQRIPCFGLLFLEFERGCAKLHGEGAWYRNAFDSVGLVALAAHLLVGEGAEWGRPGKVGQVPDFEKAEVITEVKKDSVF